MKSQKPNSVFQCSKVEINGKNKFLVMCLWESRYQHKNTEENQSTNSNQKSEKTTHRPNFLNRICGDSLKKLGIGTPVYCTLAGIVTHSGIAIGDKIVHLDGDGTIVFTSPQEFIDRLDGNNPAVNIYYAAYTGNTPLEIDFAAVHAMSQIGKKIKYDGPKQELPRLYNLVYNRKI